ncbi:MAG: DNA-methyltransferase, partial [Akkermansia sp.]
AFDPEFDTFQFMVWHKTNPVPNFRKSSFLNSCELIVTCWNKGHTWNFTTQRDMHNFIESGICMGSERVKDRDGRNLHPTQKPIAILEKIIRLASNEHDVVLDCFSGVGSTGVAALKNNRRFVGIEIDKTYMEAAEKRLSGVKQPLLL